MHHKADITCMDTQVKVTCMNTEDTHHTGDMRHTSYIDIHHKDTGHVTKDMGNTHIHWTHGTHRPIKAVMLALLQPSTVPQPKLPVSALGCALETYVPMLSPAQHIHLYSESTTYTDTCAQTCPYKQHMYTAVTDTPFSA